MSANFNLKFNFKSVDFSAGIRSSFQSVYVAVHSLFKSSLICQGSSQFPIKSRGQFVMFSRCQVTKFQPQVHIDSTNERCQDWLNCYITFDIISSLS